ncbi:putative lipoyltransferase 2, mitochondrial [Drosophila grimshawi]|uniref:Octanoyl-[acyl-carrier-protein]:protein N-octanoyltransferase LIPT2, mitochondrial n=1 Tax=Drosophila grimshawi TaxID=7222 RepID=B4K252_DROGR|nr:putative lipoyltransferase 2, mitochondrial [Drosophila grimshawi]EDW04310.1 GH11741 [Drosophila grimshawi]
MPTVQPFVTVVRAGRLSYAAGLKLQQELAKQNVQQSSDFRNYLLLLEHDPVYTIGIRTKGYTAQDEDRLRKLGADFHRTDRGGLITFHGPGQLVAYPIINLRQFKPSIRWYVTTLERTVIETCRQMGIPNASTTQDTGIWVGDRKICAIGVHGSRYVTTHGIGLNCSTDLKWFEHIVPCGIEGKGVTSLSEQLQRHISLSEATAVLLDSFSKTFECLVQEQSKARVQN